MQLVSKSEPNFIYLFSSFVAEAEFDVKMHRPAESAMFIENPFFGRYITLRSAPSIDFVPKTPIIKGLLNRYPGVPDFGI